jgi:hypothetical protein
MERRSDCWSVSFLHLAKLWSRFANFKKQIVVSPPHANVVEGKMIRRATQSLVQKFIEIVSLLWMTQQTQQITQWLGLWNCLSQRMILKYRYGASKASSSRQAITSWMETNKQVKQFGMTKNKIGTGTQRSVRHLGTVV